MPIRMTIYRPDRIVVAVASGDVVIQDIAKFFRDIIEARALAYRKILDVAGCNLAVTREELTEFGQIVREAYRRNPRAPLAIVAHSQQTEMSRFFTELTADDRPAQVFRSIHDARSWLREQS